MAIYKPASEEYSLFKCTFQTKKGKETRYVVERDRTTAGLTLMLQGRIKHTHPSIDIEKVEDAVVPKGLRVVKHIIKMKGNRNAARRNK